MSDDPPLPGFEQAHRRDGATSERILEEQRRSRYQMTDRSMTDRPGMRKDVESSGCRDITVGEGGTGGAETKREVGSMQSVLVELREMGRLELWTLGRVVDKVCSELIEREALFIDEGDFVEATLARVAGWMARYEEDPVAEDLWLLGYEALDYLIRDDGKHAHDAQVRSVARDSSVRDRFLIEAMGFAPDSVGHVAAHFNRLARPTRQVFFAVLLREVDPQEAYRQINAWDSMSAMYKEIYDTLTELRALGVPQE